MDIDPLRESAPYRRLWIGSGLSSIGGQMTSYAVTLQVFVLTRSSLAVGLIGLVIAIPTIAIAVVGGAVIDALDRRTTVLTATGLQAAVSGLLAWQAFAGLGQVWLLYCLVAVQSAIDAVNSPARRTFMPSLLRRDQLPAGAALQTLAMHGSLTTGPARRPDHRRSRPEDLLPHRRHQLWLRAIRRGTAAIDAPAGKGRTTRPARNRRGAAVRGTHPRHSRCFHR